MAEIGKKTRFKPGEEQARISKMGNERKRQIKQEKEAFTKIFSEAILERLNATDMQEITDRLIQNAKKNGGKDFELLRDTIGQRPTEKKEITAALTLEDLLNNDNGTNF